MNNRKPSMIGMKRKGTFKLDTVKLDKSETYPEESVLPEDGVHGYHCRLRKLHGCQKKISYRLKIKHIQVRLIHRKAT